MEKVVIAGATDVGIKVGSSCEGESDCPRRWPLVDSGGVERGEKAAGKLPPRPRELKWAKRGGRAGL